MALPSPDRLKSFIKANLIKCHPDFAIPGKAAQTPGYHTRIADGTLAHGTRDGAQFIVALLMEGSSPSVSQAEKALGALFALQEKNPYHPAYGIWPWFYEEPISQMAPPDWNWADFIGAQLIQVWVHHRNLLNQTLQAELKESLLRAAYSIFRRNVQPGYTNIALMGAAVTAAVGEHLGDPRLLDYARCRLRSIIDETNFHGDFNEYNSPTYTLVAIEEMDRALYLVKDSEVRKHAETLRAHGWGVVAKHFHPATGTWAGPHSRTYGDLLSPATCRLLEECAGVSPESGPPPAMALLGIEGMDFDLIPRLPCPAELVPYFHTAHGTLSTRHDSFIKSRNIPTAPAAPGSWPVFPAAIGTTAFSKEGNLASMNRESYWTQSRPAIGYWKTKSTPLVLRLRMTHNGRDFASGFQVSQQEGFQFLAAAGFLLNKGAFHPTLDRGPEPIFETRELTWRWELTGPGVAVKPLSANLSQFTGESFSAFIHHPEGQSSLGSHPWATGTLAPTAGAKFPTVFVEMMIHRGPSKNVDLREMGPTTLVTALEFGAEAPSPVAPVMETHFARWLNLEVPLLKKAGAH